MSEENNFGDRLEPPAVRPPRKISKPRIMLKMPPHSPQIAVNTPGGFVTIPLTPVGGLPQNYAINGIQAYPNKAQEFMFKQFAGFKDYTMNKGKLGLSFGEKVSFWMYEKIWRYSKKNLTHILLLFAIMLYCVLGGVIFYLVEGDAKRQLFIEQKSKDGKNILHVEMDICRMLGFTNLTGCQQRIHSSLVELRDKMYDHYHLNPPEESFGLLASIYFCGTVFTTIGYGNIAPVTVIGRIMTIIYSLFGIPLFLILLADYGKVFTRVIKFFWAYVRRLYYTGSCRKVRRTVPVQEFTNKVQLVFGVSQSRKNSENNANGGSPVGTPALSTYTIDDEFNLPISLAVSVLLLYMISGAALFAKLEGWNFFRSFYYVYISVSTIGFGDIVPSSKVSVLLCSLVYFIFGLSLTSMCINVIAEKLTDSFRQATAKIGATMGAQVAEISEDPLNGAPAPVISDGLDEEEAPQFVKYHD